MSYCMFFLYFNLFFFIYVIACWHICYIAALNELQNTVIDFILWQKCKDRPLILIVRVHLTGLTFYKTTEDDGISRHSRLYIYKYKSLSKSICYIRWLIKNIHRMGQVLCNHSMTSYTLTTLTTFLNFLPKL